MAFDDKDISVPRVGTATTSVESITFRRNRDLGEVQLKVIVTKNEDGQSRSYRVPAETVDAAWPGSSKTLKAHLLAAINAAV